MMNAENMFPVVNGMTVTERHVKVCADRGHATYTVDSVDSDICPRCGIDKATLPQYRIAVRYYYVRTGVVADSVVTAYGETEKHAIRAALYVTDRDHPRGSRRIVTSASLTDPARRSWWNHTPVTGDVQVGTVGMVTGTSDVPAGRNTIVNPSTGEVIGSHSDRYTTES
jgi:hypothetical protein